MQKRSDTAVKITRTENEEKTYVFCFYRDKFKLSTLSLDEK